MRREDFHDSKNVRESMKRRDILAKLFFAAALLIIGCNGGDATYTDGSNRTITDKGIKEKLADSRSLDNTEKRFVAFHVHEFNVSDWAKILSKPEADVRGTDVSSFSSSYWNESNLTKAEFQALLAENDGCSATLLQGSEHEYTYRLPGCSDFNNTNKPDIAIPGVTYLLYFYNLIDKPDDWTLYSGIPIAWQTNQLNRIFRENNSTIFFRNERLQRGFELKVSVVPEGPTSYEPASPFIGIKSPSPVVLERVSRSLYVVHFMENEYISKIYDFSHKNRNYINVNVIRVPRIVSVMGVDLDKIGNERYSWEKPTKIAYQNSNDDRVKDYEDAAGFFMNRAVNGQYVIFLGLEPAKDYANAANCRTTNACRELGSRVLDHVVAHENGHLLMTMNHTTDASHIMYSSIPQTLPTPNVGPPFTDNRNQRISQLRITTAGWTF